MLFILTTVTTGWKVLMPKGGTFLPRNTARVFIELYTTPTCRNFGPLIPRTIRQEKDPDGAN